MLDFTIVKDQSELQTKACHVKIPIFVPNILDISFRIPVGYTSKVFAEEVLTESCMPPWDWFKPMAKWQC